MWLVVRLILRRRSPEPESGGSIKIGLNSYKYYVCINWSGLSAFSGELYSLLRCAGGVGEAGTSYMNTLSNRTNELFLLFPPPWYPLHKLSFNSIHLGWKMWINTIQFNSWIEMLFLIEIRIRTVVSMSTYDISFLCHMMSYYMTCLVNQSILDRLTPYSGSQKDNTKLYSI